MSRSTHEIERDAEATRSELSSTLDELRRRIEPGQLVDQAFSYARNNGGADFVRNAGAQARDNPLPILLIGAGLAWLLSGRKPSSGPGLGAIGESANRRAHDARDVVGGVAGAVSNAVSAAADGVRGMGAAGKTGAQHAGGALGDMSASASDTLHGGSARAQDAISQLQVMFRDNPVAFGAIGLAIGAVIGAALPATETENQLIGAQADDLKSEAKAAAEEQMERGKRAVNAGLEEARKDAGADNAKPNSGAGA